MTNGSLFRQVKHSTKHSARQVVLVMVLAWIGISPVNAQHDCSRIKSASARLACFDAQKGYQDTQQPPAKSTNQALESFQNNAAQALAPLQKLGSSVAIGISFRDYSPAVAEIDFQVTKFLKSTSAEYSGEFSDAITNAHLAYFRAGTNWTLAVRFAGKLIKDEIIIDPGLVDLYPDLSPYTRIGYGGNTYANYNKVLSVLWSAARAETAKAERILAKVEVPTFKSNSNVKNDTANGVYIGTGGAGDKCLSTPDCTKGLYCFSKVCQ